MSVMILLIIAILILILFIYVMMFQMEYPQLADMFSASKEVALENAKILFFIFIIGIALIFISDLIHKLSSRIKAAKVSTRMKYVEKIDNFVFSVADITIAQKLKLLSKVLQKVPQRYFDEERLGKYYVPELLSALKTYCNLSEKDDAAKANILEGIEVVTGVSKSILGDLDENEKMKLEINSDVLSQMAKMDGYLSDTTLKEKNLPCVVKVSKRRVHRPTKTDSVKTGKGDN